MNERMCPNRQLTALSEGTIAINIETNQNTSSNTNNYHFTGLYFSHRIFQ